MESLDLQRLHTAILVGDATSAVSLTVQALKEGADPLQLVTTYMIPAMDLVSERFEREEYFVPELLLSGRAMKMAMEPIRPLLAASGIPPAGRVVIGTVKGDLHDIGKNLVASMLEGGGFEVTDLGTNVAPQTFVEAITDRNTHIVALSALLTVTMPWMKTTIEALRAAGLRDGVKVIVGGAPVTEKYARQIGADGYTENASGVIALARTMMRNA